TMPAGASWKPRSKSCTPRTSALPSLRDSRADLSHGKFVTLQKLYWTSRKRKRREVYRPPVAYASGSSVGFSFHSGCSRVEIDGSEGNKHGICAMRLSILALAALCGTLLGTGAESMGQQPKVDQHGDPLPPGAIARLGTVRRRHGDGTRVIAVLPAGNTARHV